MSRRNCEFVFVCFVNLVMLKNQNFLNNVSNLKVLRSSLKDKLKVKYNDPIKVNMFQCYSVNGKSKFQIIIVKVSN